MGATMFQINGEKRTLSPVETLWVFTAGLLFNAIGNGLTVATNMGSAPWTASAANIANATGWPISSVLLAYGLVAATLTMFILGYFDARRFFGNLLFVLFFSYIIGGVNSLFVQLGLMHAALPIRIIVDFLAIGSIAIGVSINQRLQLVLHPLDDLTVITRFKYFHGDAKISQIVNFSLPMFISLGVWLSTGKLVAINIGTLFAFFCQGYLIQQADKYVIPKLIHKRSSF
jgi:uncharacterized membrane protein YczE